MHSIELTPDRLRAVLDYNRATGLFVWKVATGSRCAVGSPAGANSHGYCQISVDGKLYRAHRLAWLWVHGKWPVHQVDHINGDRADNRIENLRDASSLTNNQNRHRSSNITGFPGVSLARGGKYQVSIMAAGKRHFLGSHETPELAGAAYLAAKAELHGVSA